MGITVVVLFAQAPSSDPDFYDEQPCIHFAPHHSFSIGSGRVHWEARNHIPGGGEAGLRTVLWQGVKPGHRVAVGMRDQTDMARPSLTQVLTRGLT